MNEYKFIHIEHFGSSTRKSFICVIAKSLGEAYTGVHYDWILFSITKL